MTSESVLTHFDVVLMLTWSDWWTEPRSNRFHYATRFARRLPTLFLQHRYLQTEAIRIEQSGVFNLDIVEVSCGITAQQVDDVRALLRARGFRRPLLWIYDSMNFGSLIDALPGAFRVYHATEDYLLESKGWSLDAAHIGRSVISLLGKVDYVVACSEGVANSCQTRGRYAGPLATIENGCDAEFILSHLASKTHEVSRVRPCALYQGGINQRLDYELLKALATDMPDWDFVLCGRTLESDGISALAVLPNVEFKGELGPDVLAQVMAEATVGIIPFIQDEWIRNSWPLKAYEYVAAGLPVVSVPISALPEKRGLFAFARNPSEFKAAITESSSLRWDPELLDARAAAARENSYDRRFARMELGLCTTRTRIATLSGKLRVAMLYDGTGSLHVNTIREHLEAFERYSRHEITFISAGSAFWQRSPEELEVRLDLSMFDVLIVHYSIRLSVPGHLDEGLAGAIARFGGFKVLFIQDEYDNVEVTRTAMERLGFDLVYTCVPAAGLDYVYPAYRFPSVEFLPTLTGYVPEAPGLEDFALPLENREMVVAYRGRKLPHIYGELGREKYGIGVEVQRLADMRGIAVDIEVDDSKRIYGSDWYRFLGSARSTLGTESGSNVFDIDGNLQSRIAAAIAASHSVDELGAVQRVLAPLEGRVRMNQISPKIFEAIRLRTALVLFEGDYSGVVKPGLHFIALKKDCANIDEVFDRLRDIDYLRQLTSRAYDDIVASGRYSYANFIAAVDRDLSARVFRPATKEGSLRNWWKMTGDGLLSEALPGLPVGLWQGPHPLGRPHFVEEVAQALMKRSEQPTLALALLGPSIAPTHSMGSSKLLAGQGLIEKFVECTGGLARRILVFADRHRVISAPLLVIARAAWSGLPVSLRQRVNPHIWRLLRAFKQNCNSLESQLLAIPEQAAEVKRAAASWWLRSLGRMVIQAVGRLMKALRKKPDGGGAL